MEQNILNLNKKIYSDNSNILLEIVNDLNQLINNSHDNIIIKQLGNNIINENKKNLEIIRNDISNLYNQMIKRFDDLKNDNQKEIKLNDGLYIGQVVNGIAEGKGICYFNNGQYEGEWKNNKEEGKGIYYYDNGDRYEGDFKNNKREGKGIFYYNNGNRRMGNYENDNPKGIHVTLTDFGDVKKEYF